MAGASRTAVVRHGSSVIALLLAVVLAAAGVTAAVLTVSSADDGPGGGLAEGVVTRLAGGDRYETAATVAGAWQPGVDTVYLASGAGFPDALTAAAAAGATDSPVLLTRPTTLPEPTVEALRRLRPGSIVVVGGTAAVSEEVVGDLQAFSASGDVRRLAGLDRYETAAKVAATYPAGVTEVYLANGADFPDALTVAALAGHRGMPLLLTAGDTLARPTADVLSQMAPERVVVVGGPAAVSATAVHEATELTTSKSAQRLAGADRYETAAKVAVELSALGGDVFLASGQGYPDALVGAALAGRQGSPMILTPTRSLHPAALDVVERAEPDRAWVVGGAASLSETVSDDLVGVVKAATQQYNPIGTTGALPVGAAQYPVPGGAIFVAPSGSDSAAGTETAPLRTVREALSAAEHGDTIVLRAGTYHERLPVHQTVTIQNYPGEAVWFDGSVAVSGLVRSGDAWRLDGWTAEFDSSPTYHWGESDGAEVGWQWLDPEFPMAAHPDQVWVDGVAQAQVADVRSLVDGTFFVDDDSDRLYLGADPSGKAVRVSALERALELRAPGVTLRGFGVRRYAPSVPHMGTITVEEPEATIENLVITDNATTGIGLHAAGITLHRVTVERNGLLGIGGNHADELEATHIVSSNNNLEHFNQAPVSGGLKIARSRGLTVRHAVFEDNNGPGFWADASVHDLKLTNSVLRRNEGHGVSVEISALATLAGNLIAENGRHGIKINNTSDVSIWNNTLVDNGRPLNIVQDERRGDNPDDYGHDSRRPFPDPTMPWVNGPVTIRNNILAGTTANCLLCVEDYSNEFTAEELEVTANGNVYQRDVVTQPEWLFVWSRAPREPYVFTALPRFASTTGQEAQSFVLEGYEAVGADGKARSRVVAETAQVAVPIPAQVAEPLGVPVGTKHLGAFID